jgi:hypothetical protein
MEGRSGSARTRVILTVQPSGAWSPAIDFAFPAAYSRVPLIIHTYGLTGLRPLICRSTA